jgi:uncharacterized protein
MKTTAIYTAILALLFMGLSIRVVLLRGSLRVSLGDKGDQTMLRAIRVHANFAEYVPFCLLLIYFVETSGAAVFFVHALGLMLVSARASHAYGVSQLKERLLFRQIGMALTISVMGLSAAWLVFKAVFA